MITLRQALLSDYSAIARLHADSWKMNYRNILSDDYLDNDVDNDRLDTWYQKLKAPKDNQCITVATSGDTITGFCCIYLNNDPVFGSLIDNLHVSKEHQKSGIGKMLLKDSAKYICDNTDNKKMYLWVYESNMNARAAYEKLGGTNFETVEKENPDGTKSRTCRITWEDASVFTQ